MAHLAACKRSKNHSALEPECTCNLLGISLAAHYITYIVGISRVPLYKTKTASSSFVGKSMVPQSSATSFSHRLISSACGRLVLADDPPASNRQFFGVRETHQDRQGARNLPGMNNTRNPTQDGESDVDQEIAVAAGFEEDCKRRQEECQEV